FCNGRANRCGRAKQGFDPPIQYINECEPSDTRRFIGHPPKIRSAPQEQLMNFSSPQNRRKGRPLGPPRNIRKQRSIQSGTTSPRPTLTRAVCSEPSACLVALMPTWAPGLSSLLSPATYFLITASEPMMIFFSPSLYFTMMFCPSTPDTVVSTVALVIVLFGRVHGRWPSPLPRIGSAKMITRIAFWLPSACGVAPTPMKAPFVTSDTEAFSRPHTATLLASATFCSP